ncbi:hypothetical protein EIP91_010547 [Steccherinum ochraceum]|uniref:Protein kinase domain-containing protein n=1 Tax=Steccherinum ochraceum TaxID=92696 RepID=A0A4R0R0G9_9APHY|nr:hypothetical protein EIP91_010547 [Steccherinum ochraceum]
MNFPAVGESQPPPPPPTYANSPRKNCSTKIMPDSHFGELRPYLMKTLPAKIPEVSAEWFLQHVVSKVDDRDVKEVMAKLNQDGIIVGGRWSYYSQDPSDMKQDEDSAYKYIEDISNAVLAVAAPVLKRRDSKKRITARTRCIPRRVAKSESENSGYKHDAGTILEKTTASPPLHLADLYNPDNAINWEFKLKRDAESVNENRQQFLGNAAHMMFNDPSRRFRYSVSIEDTDVRFWFLSRSICFATKIFNLATTPEPLIHFLMAVSFASRAELGYDPTVKRVAINNEIAYEYTVVGKQGKKHVFRTVEHALFSHQSHRILGRATRIWKVREVNAKGEFISPEHVLKDYWMSQNSKTEGNIQAEILEAARKARAEKGVSSDDISKHFMHILHDTVVRIGGKQDSSLSYLPNFHMPPETCGTLVLQLNITRNPTKAQISKSHNGSIAGNHPAMTPPSGNGDWPMLAGRYYEHRKHCRLVFEEVGTPLYKLRNHRTIFKSLSFALDGLKVLHEARFVHRDISTGNLLFWIAKNGEIQCKISDLEYARPYLKEIKDDDDTPPVFRTGTPAYMAVEVLSQNHLANLINFGPRAKPKRRADPSASNRLPTPVVDVLHNYAHDVEGLWWIGMWTLLYTTTPQLAEQLVNSKFSNEQELHANKIFPPIISCSQDRQSCLTGDRFFDILVGRLPLEFQLAGDIMGEARVALMDFYEQLESPLTKDRLQDHDRFASLYETMTPPLASLASEALDADQVWFDDRRKELEAQELAQAAADKKAAKEAAKEAAQQEEAAGQKRASTKRKQGEDAQPEDQNADTRASKKSRTSKVAKPSASASANNIAEPSTSRTTKSSTRVPNAKASSSATPAAAPTKKASTRTSAAKASSSKNTSPGQRSPKNTRAPAKPRKRRDSD